MPVIAYKENIAEVSVGDFGILYRKEIAHPVKNRESGKTASFLVLTTPNKSGVRGRVGECRGVALAKRQGGYRQCQ
jgi:hypothetical protein